MRLLPRLADHVALLKGSKLNRMKMGLCVVATVALVTPTATADASSASGLTASELKALASEVGALQSRLAREEAKVNGLQALLGGVSHSDDGAALTVAGNGGDANSPLKTVLFKGVNVQVENGTGSEATLNGLGNLIVGYAENLAGAERTGSHNLITGSNGGWSSYGGLLAGDGNLISGPSASVSGGRSAEASGLDSSVSGGGGNSATGFASSASGGIANVASGFHDSVSGGSANSVSGGAASATGGHGNSAVGSTSSVTGGLENTVNGTNDTILGGAHESIGEGVKCGFFPGSPTTSHC
jgi:hypothetical protein